MTSHPNRKDPRQPHSTDSLPLERPPLPVRQQQHFQTGSAQEGLRLLLLLLVLLRLAVKRALTCQPAIRVTSPRLHRGGLRPARVAGADPGFQRIHRRGSHC
jgi:hypothetical protein